ncbi:Uncharacterised protein [Paucimonas lemoignei]|jgi:hypothetical protein|nr:Uncharacterised protein [Paucimonas lemoignei]
MARITVMYKSEGRPYSAQMEDFEFASLNIGDVISLPPTHARPMVVISKYVNRMVLDSIERVEYSITTT